MSRIRSKNTKIELVVRKALHRRGHRFRVHLSGLPGKPDIVFTKVRLAIFIDGDFWHGRQFSEWEKKLGPYWRKKISGNIERDQAHAAQLKREGWLVLRIWEVEIIQNLNACVLQIERVLADVRRALRSG